MMVHAMEYRDAGDAVEHNKLVLDIFNSTDEIITLEETRQWGRGGEEITNIKAKQEVSAHGVFLQMVKNGTKALLTRVYPLEKSVTVSQLNSQLIFNH